jgi:DNA-binding response OmpR family regulator
MASVLIVDDDRQVRDSLADLLTENGWQVSVHDGGEAALAALRSASYDALISDVDMPDISGFELLARLEHHHITVPAILISARAGDALDQAAAQAGVTLLAKPVSGAALLTTLTALITNNNGGAVC